MKQKMCRSIINRLDNEKYSCVVGKVFTENVDENPQWLAKDVVYQFKCNLCQECYTGETSRPVHKRVYNHWYGLCRKCEKESALTQHYMDHHPGQEMSLELVKLVKTYGFVERKIMESVVQAT